MGFYGRAQYIGQRSTELMERRERRKKAEEIKVLRQLDKAKEKKRKVIEKKQKEPEYPHAILTKFYHNSISVIGKLTFGMLDCTIYVLGIYGNSIKRKVLNPIDEYFEFIQEVFPREFTLLKKETFFQYSFATRLTFASLLSAFYSVTQLNGSERPFGKRIFAATRIGLFAFVGTTFFLAPEIHERTLRDIHAL